MTTSKNKGDAKQSYDDLKRTIRKDNKEIDKTISTYRGLTIFIVIIFVIAYSILLFLGDDMEYMKMGLVGLFLSIFSLIEIKGELIRLQLKKSRNSNVEFVADTLYNLELED